MCKIKFIKIVTTSKPTYKIGHLKSHLILYILLDVFRVENIAGTNFYNTKDVTFAR